MEPLMLPDIEGDTDFANLGDPSRDPRFTEVKPGSPEWEEADAFQAAAIEPEPEKEDKFPDEIDQDLRGLMFLGALERSFPFLGHDFVMRTLTTGEELACSMVIKEYAETLGSSKAFATAFVGASIVSVDGIPMIKPLGPDQTLDVMRQRFVYVARHWFWPVVEALYDEYAELTLRQANVFKSLEGKLQASRRTSSS